MKISPFQFAILLSIFLSITLVGCVAPSRSRYTGFNPTFVPTPVIRKADPVKTIVIASIPAGCIVEMNGEYIGQAPFSLTVNADSNGCWPKFFSDGKQRSLVNRFTCTAPNGSTDSRTWYAESRIPDTVLFRPYRSYPASQPLRLGLTSGL